MSFENKYRKTSLSSSTGKYSFCPNTTFEIRTDSSEDFIQYKWFKDGSILSDNKPHITVSQGGKYSIQRIDIQNGCTYIADTTVLKNQIPTAQISTLGNTSVFCVGDSIELKGVALPKATIQWQKDGINVGKNIFGYFTKLKGKFSYSVVDSNGCKNISANYTLDTVSKITVKLNPLAEICADGSPVSLSGYPLNGQYAGIGIKNDAFDPKISGVGTFKITYSITSGMKCQQGSAEQSIIVNPLPKPTTLPATIFVNKGNSVILNSGAFSGYTYQWSPATYLDANNKGNPTSKPDKDIEYIVKIISDKGCVSEGKVKISVASKILIPTAFTPNNDGTNDTWQLFGIENYPESEVLIYNRWGELIFYSKGYLLPFDGKWQNGIDLPNDDYAYLIKVHKPLSDEVYEFKGALALFR